MEQPDPSPRGHARLPRRLVLVDASPTPPDELDGCIGHLLADFEDALRAYERLSAREERKRAAAAGEEPPEAGGLEVEHVRWLEAASAKAGGLGGLGGLDGLDGFDAAVVGCADSDAAELERLLAALKPGSRVYAIVVTPELRTDAAWEACGQLAARCGGQGLVWSGALAVYGGLIVARQAGTPRMGRKRRARSEGIDLVIAAVRSGMGVAELPGAPGDVIDAPCSTPSFLYRRLFPAAGKHGAAAPGADAPDEP